MPDKGVPVEERPTMRCAWCSKPILVEPIEYQTLGEVMYFDTRNCLTTYRKLHSVYGDTFLDEEGKYKAPPAEPVKVAVSKAETVKPSDTAPILFEFKSTQSRQAFDSLVEAFIRDYMHNRRNFDQSGWRSLTEIARIAKVSLSSLYGKHGRYGPALNELLSRGLVETRFISGHRGRGGEVVRFRVNYEREPVKRYVERSMAKP